MTRDKNRLFKNGFLTHLLRLGIIEDDGRTPAGDTGTTEPENAKRQTDEIKGKRWADD